MQSGGVARFAKGLLSKPCSCCDSNPAPLEGLQYIWAQRCFSTSDRVSAPASLHNSADKGAETQPNQLGAKDAARVAHASDIRNLRRKWQAEHAQKLAIQAKAEAVKTANKAVSIEAHRVKVAQIKELRTQIHEEKRRLQIAEQVQRQALATKFRAATQGVYAQVKSERRDDLLQESRDWITPETLDARIEHALDNPVELYDLLAQQDWNYKDGGKNSP